MTDQARQRIDRLTRAIGDGPHSTLVDPRQHLRSILVTLGDKTAVELLRVDSTLGPRSTPRSVASQRGVETGGRPIAPVKSMLASNRQWRTP